jgi:hypothetical protein
MKRINACGGLFNVSAWVVLPALLTSALAARAGLTGFSLGDAANYAAIFQGGGGNALNINNPSGLFDNTDAGNIGIAGTGQLAVSGPLTINGNVNFAGTVNVNGQYNNGGNVIITGSVVGGQLMVQTDMNNLNSLSTMLGIEGGTSVALNSGGTINASTGTIDAMGNSVFNVSSINAPNGTLTINGDGIHKVVFNISAGVDQNLHFNSIVLTGGLTPDDVLFNLYGGNSLTLTGGPNLSLNSNGGTLNGIFLDPFGDISLTHSILAGRIFGGDSHNEAIVSGGTLLMPQGAPVPEPSTVFAGVLLLLPLGLGVLRNVRRHRSA